MTNIGVYIKRKESKLLQREVAEKIGISNQSYYLKETGKRDFTIPEAKRLAILYNCKLDDLFGRELNAQ